MIGEQGRQCGGTATDIPPLAGQLVPSQLRQAFYLSAKPHVTHADIDRTGSFNVRRAEKKNKRKNSDAAPVKK